MPIEIRELHIKVLVDPPVSGNDPSPADPDADKQKKSDDLIAETVDQVMKILNEKKER